MQISTSTVAVRVFWLSTLGCAALTLSACERPERGDIVNETRKVEDFQAVELRGTGELVVTVGAPTAVEMSGTSRTLKNTDTYISGDRLIIEVSKRRWDWFGDQGGLRIKIATPTLKLLRSNGAGDISINGLNGGDHEIHVAGAHDVKAEGKVDNLVITLEGAGNVDYRKVNAADATVTLNGAGDAEVQVAHVLRATVNGVGAIHYEGQPEKVESQIHGVGSISRR